MNKELIYVIQQHHASHLHWDLRLEHEGVLKSWAIPKEPPKAAGVKRLAVAVDDHELGYEKFVGEIAKGEYGAGKVEIWDSGTYIPEKFDKEHIILEINGKKLKGKYYLIKFKGQGKNWLFFKK
jgi:DNA ligase D-like protein (predicted 3'-phosphoesterase)